jgi:tRNA pseudouridine55 synthase
VLPIALGEATKTVPFLMDADKSYRFTIAWGRTTATHDREGDTLATSDVRPTIEQVQAVLPRFIGEIDQVPPAYSAIKVDGERAYDLARAGEEVELAARKVVIFDARVVDAPDEDHITLDVDCGKGTYVRALVRDIAETLGACGHVSALRRTRVGRFTEQSAVTLELLEDLGHKARQSEALLPVETALDDIPVLAVTDEDAFRLKQGRSIVLVPRQVEAVKARLKPGSRTVSAMAGERVVALCEMRAGRLEPSRVFNL